VNKRLGFKACLPVFILVLPLAATAQEIAHLPNIDRTRIAEAFRIADTLGNRVWKDWSTAPLATLLITQEHEFLVRHPNPPGDFKKAGTDALLRGEVYFRKRVFQMDFLATFPLNGVPTIIIGQAENTMARTSTPWVVTLLHEHFHQLQYSRAGYYNQVAELGLARGDATGMWMLNFPFPYTEPRVDKSFTELCRTLAAALDSGGTGQFVQNLSAYVRARKSFVQMLAADDYKYLSFQLWQEGVARYTEHRIAQLAASDYSPTQEFRFLGDFTPFEQLAGSLLKRIKSELVDISLSNRQRVAFYSVGAAEAMLADLAHTDWQERYFAEKFSTETYFANR
jgi:hypothetical protein